MRRTVQDRFYRRTVRVKRRDREFTGVVQVGHDVDKQMLAVRLSDGLLPVCALVLERLKRLFDLAGDPAAINAALGSLAESRPGLRVPGSFDAFETAVRAILGQQISVAAASTLAGRLVRRWGTEFRPGSAGLTHLFPAPQAIARMKPGDLTRLGIIGRRAETLIALAQEIDSGRLLLEPGHRVEGTLRQLRAIPGIGDWTAQYIAMRALSWPDAFPHTDLGICKALGEKNPQTILKIAEQWRPWRAYATLHLWAGLEKKL